MDILPNKYHGSTTSQISCITCGHVTPQELLTFLPAPWSVTRFFPQVSWIYYPTNLMYITCGRVTPQVSWIYYLTSLMHNLWTSHPTSIINITPRTMISSPHNYQALVFPTSIMDILPHIEVSLMYTTCGRVTTQVSWIYYPTSVMYINCGRVTPHVSWTDILPKSYV